MSGTGSDLKTKQDHAKTHVGQTVTWVVDYLDDPDPGPGQGPAHYERHTCSVCGSSVCLLQPGPAPTE